MNLKCQRTFRALRRIKVNGLGAHPYVQEADERSIAVWAGVHSGDF